MSAMNVPNLPSGVPRGAAIAPPHPPTAREGRCGSLHRRSVAAVVAAASGALLGIAAWLTPSPEGIGTHRQLGVPECGWITGMGLPCPTCGMTTAFAHAADGDLLESFRCQPAGAVLAVVTAMVLLSSLLVAVTGRSIAPLLRLGGRPLTTTPAFWTSVGSLILFAWGWKIAMVRGWL
ncbi:MAG TPA: DUF2752 domain-containing protein [Phycisphaerales bacterium]|nr:DUF2752 domain-containing protein [Phycisphaerales bacterium]HMP36734.1 DUF2752 domain-containing protein [Phycisphaerales bacterium]